MGTRRPHHKSRTGCVQCKKRRIKCDETKPRCSHCKRNLLPCSFVSLASSFSRSRSKPEAKNISAGPVQPNPLEPISVPFQDQGLSQKAFTIIDIELYHHYITDTGFTIAHEPLTRKLWCEAIPVIGLSQPFLMHGLLAISALHLTHLHPKKKDAYTLLAASHQDKAFQGFRSALADISTQNCNAVFAFSLLLVKYAFAAPRAAGNLVITGSSGNKNSSTTEWLRLLRGIKPVVVPIYPIIAAGPLGSLVQLNQRINIEDDLSSVQQLPREDSYLLKLYGLWDQGTPLSGTPEVGIYIDALNALRVSFAQATPIDENDGYDALPIFVWPFRISESYITLLDQQKEEALIILAYYFVLVDKLKTCWWIDGMATDLIEKIFNILDKKWRQWIEWPMQMVGVTGPPRNPTTQD
ncbi:MAG: hypothetical protein M1834_008849 [Cirrosporium novae-zelandiae]|nr:MAG: hypothetical protein M1834_008849 [Cirrosporium novae-zelandiae]